jgi:hypothetical protein
LLSDMKIAGETPAPQQSGGSSQSIALFPDYESLVRYAA